LVTFTGISSFPFLVHKIGLGFHSIFIGFSGHTHWIFYPLGIPILIPISLFHIGTFLGSHPSGRHVSLAHFFLSFGLIFLFLATLLGGFVYQPLNISGGLLLKTFIKGFQFNYLIGPFFFKISPLLVVGHFYL